MEGILLRGSSTKLSLCGSVEEKKTSASNANLIYLVKPAYDILPTSPSYMLCYIPSLCCAFVVSISLQVRGLRKLFLSRRSRVYWARSSYAFVDNHGVKSVVGLKVSMYCRIVTFLFYFQELSKSMSLTVSGALVHPEYSLGM